MLGGACVSSGVYLSLAATEVCLGIERYAGFVNHLPFFFFFSSCFCVMYIASIESISFPLLLLFCCESNREPLSCR